MRTTFYVTIILVSLTVATSSRAVLTSNSWKNLSSGKWETSGNWLPGAPSSSESADLITNTAAPSFALKVITVDATTSGSFPSTMTISNLFISRVPATATNELFLNEAGATPLHILSDATISDGGFLLITNSALSIDGSLRIGGAKHADMTVLADSFVILDSVYLTDSTGTGGTLTIAGGFCANTNNSFFIGGNANGTGTLWVTGGQLNTGSALIGSNGVGQATVSNGTWLADNVGIGIYTPGSQGTLTVAGGNIKFISLFLGVDPITTGMVWQTGGQLILTNGTTYLGFTSVGQITVSNGTMLAGTVWLGLSPDSQGTLTVAGGVVKVTRDLGVGLSGTGSVWLTGGQLVVTNSTTCIGSNAVGQVTVSNGTWLVKTVVVGDVGNALGACRGTLTVAGGTSLLSSVLDVGHLADSTGAVWVTGGQMIVTNDNIFVGDGGVGQMTVSNGTMLATNVYVGFNGGANGTLTVAGGFNQIAQYLILGESALATGTVTITDGAEVDVTNSCNAYTVVGDVGVGYLNLLNGGTLRTANYILGAGGGIGFENVSGGNLLNNICSVMDLRRGTFTLNSGSVLTHNLVMTNANGHFVFNGGLLSVQNATVSNAQVFTVGSNGTYQATGGIQSFANGLIVRTNATLSGSGTVAGNVLIQGNVQAAAGATLTFSAGSVTNNGLMRALSGSVLEAYGPVVNNGSIVLSGGTTNFHSTFSGSGIVVTGNTNSWNDGTGKWETSGNWSLGNPSVNDAADLITNTGNNTITMDTTTAGNPATMTISNLTLSANTLQLTNAIATTFHILKQLVLSNNASLLITNSVVLVDNIVDVDGRVSVASGQLIVTNGASYVGFNSTGQIVLSNGTWLARDVIVGENAGSSGTLTIAGGTNLCSSFLTVGDQPSATGAVWLTGGQLVVTNTSSFLGNSGVANVAISNGTMLARTLTIASGIGSRGTLTVAGGTLSTLPSGATIYVGGNSTTATGTVWVTGGTVTPGQMLIGNLGVGQVTVSNGLLAVLSEIGLGSLSIGGRGTLTAAGGVVTAQSLTMGRFDCTATGTVVVVGGNLYVTNAAHNAVMDVRSGTVTVSGGSLVVDTLVVTNSCGRFLHTGGTLSITTTNLAANLDADNDGLPNSWEQQYSLDPFNGTGKNGPNGDPDGDGFTNMQEFLLGTDPTNSASAFRIIEVAPDNEDMLITWTAVGGKRYVLQTTAGSSGSYSNNFIDLNPAIVAPGAGETAVTVIHLGGATNFPARYYRVRLVP